VSNPYAVKTLKMASGEWLPLLMDRATGAPHFAATIYSLTQLRGRSRASKTIEHVLRGIMVLQLFLEQRGINLEGRFNEGRIFDLGEVEELAKHCSLHMDEVVPHSVGEQRPLPVTLVNRGRGKSVLRTIDSASAGGRIRSIAAYLSWLAMGHLLKLPADSAKFQALDATRRMGPGSLAGSCA
jgi:hypothetical protein